MIQLTPKQEQIYRFILTFTEERGYPPSVREIADGVGLKSPSTVHFHLKGLEEAGVITRESGKTRSISAVNTDAPPAGRSHMIPVLGNVAAGEPILAEEQVEEYIPFDVSGDECFALRIRGESMLNAGIFPDDLVIVRRQQTAQNGEIVIALIGEEATCKRLHFDRDGRVWLLPENDDYEPIDGTFCRILGKVIGLQRRY